MAYDSYYFGDRLVGGFLVPIIEEKEILMTISPSLSNESERAPIRIMDYTLCNDLKYILRILICVKLEITKTKIRTYTNIEQIIIMY